MIRTLTSLQIRESTVFGEDETQKEGEHIVPWTGQKESKHSAHLASAFLTDLNQRVDLDALKNGEADVADV